MNKQINEMSLSELKVMAYDIIAMRERVDRDLQIINGEIAKKSQEQEEEKVEEKKKK